MRRFLFSFSRREGFSVLELLMFSAIFTVVMIIFVTILVAVVRVQGRQSSVAEVNQQSQFLLQQIQYFVERSSLIDMPQDASTSTLRLRMPAASEDPTSITLSGGTAYLQQGGAQTPLTSNKVSVSSLNFVKRSNPPGHDTVSVSFMVQYNTSNLQQKFVQSLNTAIARVSAATFDSNLIPSSTATYDLGVTSQIWRSINNQIYFNGTNVGVGISSANAKFQVDGGNIYVDTVGNGLMLRSSDGVCWLVKPTTAGAYSSASTTCP